MATHHYNHITIPMSLLAFCATTERLDAQAMLEAKGATATIFDAWWTDEDDYDNDECLDGTAHLHWDPDVVGGGSLCVFEKVYFGLCNAGNWNLFHTTTTHLIDGVDVDDIYVDIPMTGRCLCFDYRV